MVPVRRFGRGISGRQVNLAGDAPAITLRVREMVTPPVRRK
jgi:hypothetical protein